MKNFVQPGNTITLTAPAAGILSGQPFAAGDLVGVDSFDAAAGDDVEAGVEGVYSLPVKAAVLRGDPAYFDPIASNFTTDPSLGSSRAGVFTRTGVGVADVKLTPVVDLAGRAGGTATLTAPEALVAGQAFLVGSLVAVALHDAAAAAPVIAAIEGIYSLPVDTAVNEGATVYWDDVAKDFTLTDVGNTRAGIVVTAAGGAGNTDIKLTPGVA